MLAKLVARRCRPLAVLLLLGLAGVYLLLVAWDGGGRGMAERLTKVEEKEGVPEQPPQKVEMIGAITAKDKEQMKRDTLKNEIERMEERMKHVEKKEVIPEQAPIEKQWISKDTQIRLWIGKNFKV